MRTRSLYRRLLILSVLVLCLVVAGGCGKVEEPVRYCCQLDNGCIDGPVDGQQQCRDLGGTPVEGALCQNGECVPQ